MYIYLYYDSLSHVWLILAYTARKNRKQKKAGLPWIFRHKTYLRDFLKPQWQLWTFLFYLFRFTEGACGSTGDQHVPLQFFK